MRLAFGSLENEAFSERVAASRLNRIRWADLRDREREEAFELLQNRLDDNPEAIDYGFALRGYSLQLEEAVLDNDRSFIMEYGQTLRDLFDQSLDIEFLTSRPEPSFLGQARALVGEEFVRPLPENSVDHAQAVLLIGQLEAAHALNNQRVPRTFPRTERGGRPPSRISSQPNSSNGGAV